MGIADREYYRVRPAPPPPPGAARDVTRLGPVTLTLIVLNVAVAVLDPILFNAGVHYPQPVAPEFALPLRGLGHFSLLTTIYHMEIWRLITFQFIHGGPAHLVLNMLALYFFGPMVENYLGSRRFAGFYLLCGIGGPVAYLLLWKARILIASPAAPLVGASAGIFGILVAAAHIAPNATVLIYGILPVKLRTVAWMLLAVAVYTVLAYGGSARHNAGGEAAHLGGAIAGAILIRNTDWLKVFDFNFFSRRRPPPF